MLKALTLKNYNITVFKELLLSLVNSEIKNRHRDKILGLLWTILDPLMLMLVYLFLVMVVFGHRERTYPIYLYIGLITWRYLSLSVLTSTNCFVSNRGLLMQAYFPRVIIPLIQLLSSAYDVLFSCVGLVILFLILHISPTYLVIYVPLVFMLQTVFNLGLTLIFSIFGTMLTDVNNIMKFVLRLGWYLSPGLYPISKVPEKYHLLYMANPMACFFEVYRDLALYNKIPDIGMIVYLVVVSIVILFLGIIIFSRYSPEIIKKL